MQYVGKQKENRFFSYYCQTISTNKLTAVFILAHQALADVEALEECLFKTELEDKMATIRLKCAKEQESEWHGKVKLRREMKKLIFNFGQSVTQHLARKMAREGVTYRQIEELYTSSKSTEAFRGDLGRVIKST